MPPSTVAAVIVAVPTDTPITTPFATWAMAALLLLHVTFWFVALDGDIIAVKVSALPMESVVTVLLRAIPVTATPPPPLWTTVTSQVAVLLPSAVVTEMTAVPAEMPLTTPPAETETTAGALLLHVTFWFEALAGATAAAKLSVPPTARVVDILLSVIPVTGIFSPPLWITVTMQYAVLLPSTVVMVMKEVPADRPVTMPPGVTEAMAGMLLAQITELFEALKGKIVKDKASVPPTARTRLLLMRLTPVTATLPLLAKSSSAQDAENKTITTNRAAALNNLNVVFIMESSLYGCMSVRMCVSAPT
jgi:hypothetical protein